MYLTDTALELIGDGTGYIFPSEKAKKPLPLRQQPFPTINRGYPAVEATKLVANQAIKAAKN